MPRARPLLHILAHGVHASRFRSYDGNAAHSSLHHHSFTWQVAMIMLAKLRASVGVLRLGERLAARRGASMQRWQDGAAASGWRDTEGLWRPRAPRTPICACSSPKWALGARIALELDQDRHVVPIPVVRTMSHVCMRGPQSRCDVGCSRNRGKVSQKVDFRVVCTALVLYKLISASNQSSALSPVFQQLAPGHLGTVARAHTKRKSAPLGRPPEAGS